jgi:hypothetical protein
MSKVPDNNTVYLTDVLPLNRWELVDLYTRAWAQRNENAWYGYIPKTALYFDDPLSVTKQTLDNYFSGHRYQKHPDEILEYDRGEDSSTEYFAKLVWLTHDYFRYNGFQTPICAHYNPRLDCNVIHPGGSRNQILNLFGDDKLEAMYFNTGGVEPPWLADMKKIDIADFMLNRGWAAGAVPDHGSLIPHFVKKTHWIPLGIRRFQRYLYKLMHASSVPLQIKSNTDLEYLGPWQVSDASEHDVRVDAHHQLDQIDQIKITLLACAKVNYQYKNYKITCKKPIN